MPIGLTIEKGPYPDVARAAVLRRAKRMLEALALGSAELSIVLTNDERIHVLNKQYRGIDRATDVLAFAMSEGEHGAVSAGVLGDVIISVPTARQQAKTANRETLAEVTMLLAHGLLHLLGWDHDTDARDRKMKAETDRLCVAASSRTRTLVLKRSACK